MPGLAYSEITIKDYPTFLNPLVLDVDPTIYEVFNVPIRGSSTKVLDGTVIQQFFGLKEADHTLQLQGSITELDTLKELWSRYRSGGSGVQYLLEDWYGNQFVFVFNPGTLSFHPQPITGAINGHSYSLELNVITIVQLFGVPY